MPSAPAGLIAAGSQPDSCSIWAAMIDGGAAAHTDPAACTRRDQSAAEAQPLSITSSTGPVPGSARPASSTGPARATITSPAASLTVVTPAPGASEPQTGVVFSGDAGAADGDSATLELTLYRGATPAGEPLGSERVTRDGTNWSDALPTSLALGTYTLKVTQTDLAGATTVTRTFRVAPPGDVTGAITISRTGRLTAKLSCLDGAGTCEGDVLILTQSRFQPRYGGPLGRLALMFEHYSVAAASSATLATQLTPAQLTALRAATHGIKLEVTVAYSVGAKLTEYSHVTRPVKVG